MAGALLALDPSVAHIGYAVLGMRPSVSSLGGATWPLLAIGTWHIPASDDQGSVALETRLRRMGQALDRLRLDGWRAGSVYAPLRHAVIERPVTSTVYARHRARGREPQMLAASRERQELATGALWAMLEAAGIAAHFAAPVQRRYRTTDLLGRLYPDLPRTSEHARAALALGLAALSDHRRVWSAA